MVGSEVELQEEGCTAPMGSNFIHCHLNFEVKMSFTQKARFVSGGHMTDPPTIITYSSVVLHNSVQLAFLWAALNDLDLLAADISNTYLNAPVCGIEFGQQNLGKVTVITRVLFGLKSSSTGWRLMHSASQQDLDFKSTIVYPDKLLRPDTINDGQRYYESKMMENTTMNIFLCMLMIY